MAEATFLLPQYSLLRATGKDNRDYLQGQLTCDLKALTAQTALLGALCNAKGKLQSILLVVQEEQDILLVVSTTVAESTLQALRKFAVFANVEFCLDDAPIAARLSEAPLSAPQAPFVVTHDAEKLVIKLDDSRQLVLHDTTAITDQAAQQTWNNASIRAGWPELNTALVDRVIPQQLNLEQLGAISYEKGCYLGQETVTRSHFRGGIKRGVFRLEGYSHQAPTIASDLEVKRGDSWRRGGQIISVGEVTDNRYQLLALLPLDSNEEEQYRLHPEAGDDEVFTLAALPYPTLQAS